MKMLDISDDDLVGVALMFMKSISDLNALREKLDAAKRSASKIIWASFINGIKDGDEEMKRIALNEMDSVTEKYSLISMFHYQSSFGDPRINGKIKAFTHDTRYLVAYNARTALGIDTAEIVKREQLKNGMKIKRK